MISTIRRGHVVHVVQGHNFLYPPYAGKSPQKLHDLHGSPQCAGATTFYGIALRAEEDQ